MLNTQRIQKIVEECASTNDLARELAASGAPHGSWVSAYRQTQGRGRSGRSWISEQGGLYLSLIARIPAGILSWLPLTTGLGVVKAIEDLNSPCGKIKIKWPNDLWTSKGKLGGILCEGVSTPQGQTVVIGIGVNGFVAPTGTAIPVDCTGVDPDLLRPAVAERVLQSLAELISGGPSQVIDRYHLCALLGPGKTVEWQEGERRGKVIGLGSSGELLVRLEDGKTQSLYAEDVKLSAF